MDPQAAIFFSPCLSLSSPTSPFVEEQNLIQEQTLSRQAKEAKKTARAASFHAMQCFASSLFFSGISLYFSSLSSRDLSYNPAPLLAMILAIACCCLGIFFGGKALLCLQRKRQYKSLSA